MSLVSPPDQSVLNTLATTFTASITASSPLVSATLYVGGVPQTTVLSGPVQVEDAEISTSQPDTSNGTGTSINVDGQNPHAHGLIKFPGLLGYGTGQIPPGSTITSATLGLNCTNPGDLMQIFRLTEDWSENQATWNERSFGVPWSSQGADGIGSNTGIALSGDCTVAGQRSIDITLIVQEWSSGSPNYGIVLVDTGTNGIDFDSSESGSSPTLTVVYQDDQQAVATQALSGTSATVDFPATLGGDGTYFWNIVATDSGGQESRAPADFELTVNTGAPDEAVLITPPDGSGGVSTSPTLAVAVSNPGGGMLDVTFSARPTVAEEFTIIALPDTQYYSESFPEIYSSQTAWIANNKVARNIVFVTHLGDIVEHAGVVTEWQAADASMSALDTVVPYGMGPGNHDQPTTLYNQFFPYTRYDAQPWYGGHFEDKNDNNYQLFTGGGIDFLIIHLDFCPPPAVVTWADSILAAHPDRTAIITTHGYLNTSGQRSVNHCPDTQYLWDGLVPLNPNVHFMLCGHEPGESRRTDMINGHPVFQMLADYQSRSSGGEGWLRILRFVPAENKVYVQTYSPWLNQYETDANSEFTLDFPMGGDFSVIDTITVPSGSTASVVWPGLSAFKEYEWQVQVTNNGGESRTAPVWSFTTGSGIGTNQPPVAIDRSIDVTEDTAQLIVLTAADSDGDPLNYTVVGGPGNGILNGSAPNLSYQPGPDFNGADSFTFVANDGQMDSNTATVSITVQPVNDAPTATGEAYSLLAGSSINVSAPGVLGNDDDVDSGTLTAVILNGTAHGAVTLNLDGSFSYTPDAGYSGPDVFTYRASDGLLLSNTATVDLDVVPYFPPNEPPVADDQSVSISANTAVSIVLTASDPDTDPLTFLVVSAPLNGILDGTEPDLTYTPDPGYTGPDDFAFIANDGAVDSNVATVSIDVQAPSGDLNGDGFVDVADVLLAQQMLLGLIPINLADGDVAPLIGGVPAPDGQFTPGDLLIIMRKALKLISF